MDENNLDQIDSIEKADELLEQIERPSHEAAPEREQAPVDEFELTVGGKQIKAKRDQLMQWAQQGYSAPGQISKLTKEVESWKQKWSSEEPKWKSMQEKYGPVDEYVRQNPQFWDHVVKNFEKRNQVLNDQANPLAATVNDLQKQMQDLIQYKNQIEDQRTKQVIAQEDQAYTKNLDEMQKAYPDIDFSTPGEDGKSLEYKVLEHAQANGIANFKTAFRDFYHDQLVARAESTAKEKLTKDRQKNTKLGILGISPSPTKRVSSDHRGKSWNEIGQEAIDELGLSN